MDDAPGTVDEPFGVSHVLAGELPTELGTPGAPERYDVAAVFTRRPDPSELELLEATNVTSLLAEAGYGRVRLHTSDRRLIIEHTNLEELAGGLAAVIGGILADIGTEAATEKLQRADTAARRQRAETDRASTVLAAAMRIDFRPRRSNYE